jgi:hypothetical protein
MQYNSLKQMPSGGLASFLESNMDEIGDNVLAFGSPSGINSMTDIGNRMAGMGRNGDTELVHMKTGEIAVSPELLEENPRLASELTNAFQRSNVDMDRYTVGSAANSINPITGQREFFLKKLVSGVKKLFKAVAPVILPMAINFFAPGLGTVASGALGAGIGTLAQGGSFKDAFKSAVIGGFAGGISAAAGVGGPKGAETGFERAFGKLGGMDTTILRPGTFGTPPAANTVTTPTVDSSTAVTDKFTAPESTGFVDSAKSFYNENLSPSRNMPTNAELFKEVSKLQTAAAAEGVTLSQKQALEMATKNLTPGLISQYAPLAAVGTAAMGAFGGFETPEEDLSSPYGYTSREEFERDPNKYSIYSGINFQRPLVGQTPDINRNPFVFQDYLAQPPVQQAAMGGEMDLMNDPRLQKERMFPRRNGYIAGPGTETSDDIPAMLSDGEFVMTAKAVRGLGNGSRKQGVRKMYDMMRAFEGGVVA